MLPSFRVLYTKHTFQTETHLQPVVPLHTIFSVGFPSNLTLPVWSPSVTRYKGQLDMQQLRPRTVIRRGARIKLYMRYDFVIEGTYIHYQYIRGVRHREIISCL